MKQHFRKLAYLAGISGMLLGFSGCFSTGYVSSEPAYVHYNRPAQPSIHHVWVGDGWGFNRNNHSYVQKNGHWKKPVLKSRSYTSGHWQATPKGKKWKSGKWENKRR